MAFIPNILSKLREKTFTVYQKGTLSLRPMRLMIVACLPSLFHWRLAAHSTKKTCEVARFAIFPRRVDGAYSIVHKCDILACYK